MKRLLIGLGTCAIVLVNPIALPVWAQIQQFGETIAQNLIQEESPITMQLSVDKQVDADAESTSQWKALSGEQIQVKPSDILRYRLEVQNTGEHSVENLVVTQPVPERTVYVLDSAASAQQATVSYSIDGGVSFLAEPVIFVTLADGTTVSQPAPAEMYTHISWDISQVPASDNFAASYQVEVQ